MEETKELITTDDIRSKVYIIRGQQVMLDIDLLSYATYLKCEGKDYKSESLLSLSGVYQPKKEKKYRKISGRFYVSTI